MDELALGSYFRASTLEMGRKSCFLASRGMGYKGLVVCQCLRFLSTSFLL
ncbi:hypothetical protein FOC4_g10010965 [Fusarium odoratissimum]|uniref:Uncharacterized protein n=2 Tax=Fusarium oxysporum species complex TaxID=171631 RepID=N1RHI4_FUSC4|nr:hypothetical protein FOC4_g10010965 [Fusarium odoratissimum]TXC09246.1 hypothetical protein FocTR4_00004799 [Fusarium oxysporum f. sp. cubense]